MEQNRRDHILLYLGSPWATESNRMAATGSTDPAAYADGVGEVVSTISGLF